jgi:hypothetical protein
MTSTLSQHSLSYLISFRNPIVPHLKEIHILAHHHLHALTGQFVELHTGSEKLIITNVLSRMKFPAVSDSITIAKS